MVLSICLSVRLFVRLFVFLSFETSTCSGTGLIGPAMLAAVSSGGLSRRHRTDLFIFVASIGR